MARNPATTVVELVGQAFPECLLAYRELQRLDGEYEDEMYDFQGRF
jgi:hypothetical protein